jgi:hypothetical protein
VRRANPQLGGGTATPGRAPRPAFWSQSGGLQEQDAVHDATDLAAPPERGKPAVWAVVAFGQVHGVWMMPGETALTRLPREAYSMASDLVAAGNRVPACAPRPRGTVTRPRHPPGPPATQRSRRKEPDRSSPGAEPRPAVPPRDERLALERAAELSPDREPCAQRLVSAATIAVPWGQTDCRW